MFESRSRIVLLTFLALAGSAACAQQPQQAPAPTPQAQPQLTTLPGPPPEIVAAEAEAATRRYKTGSDLHELVAQVAASTGKEFLLDPRVRARVYSVPPLRNPTYPELLSVLRLNGYVAVEIGDKVNIMPDANARALPTRLLQRDDASVPDDEIVTRVITVPNAGYLVPILRPMMPQHAHLAAGGSPDQNKLIVTDTYANVRRITELVQTLGQ
jgi:type II secretory pathway component GspD/PulD (secretin)